MYLSSQRQRFGRSHAYRAFIFVVVLGFSCTLLNRATAQTRQTVADPKVGLAIDISSWQTWQLSGGYNPVKFTIRNSKGARRLKLTLRHTMYSGMVSYSDTVKVVDLEPNSSSTLTLSIPMMQSMNTQVFVEENGRRLQRLNSWVSASANWSSTPLVISDAARTPDTRTMGEAFQQALGARDTNQVVRLRTATAPRKWIDYTSRDMVVIDMRDLQALSADRLEPLLIWTMSGGNLLIHDVGPDREKSAVLNSLLDTENRFPRDAEWIPARPEHRQLLGNKAAKVPNSFFVLREFGFGKLLVSEKNVFDNEVLTLDWVWVINTVRNRMNWVTRHGISPGGHNEDFWGFIIPGVGRAPVRVFQGLITLFVIVIGPFNYFFLKKRKRLYLLVLTVPVLAGLTCVLVLGWGIAADGFDVHCRARSLTQLNQARGEATSWTRLCYYAGLTPADGLSFSGSTAVYPIRNQSIPARSSTLEWTEDQHFEDGWLPPRTPTQFLTIDHRQTTSRLRATRDSNGKMRVTNELRVRVKLILLRDKDGEYHFAKGIDHEERLEAVPVDQTEALRLLTEAITAQSLEPPPELDFDRTGFMNIGPRYYSGSTDATYKTALMEQTIDGLSTNVKRFDNTLRRGGFVAITDRPAEIELGTMPITEVDDGLHVVIGNY